jgi:hypothetical protein
MGYTMLGAVAETRVQPDTAAFQHRIAWRLQALAKGDLSERAGRRATELANLDGMILSS